MLLSFKQCMSFFQPSLLEETLSLESEESPEEGAEQDSQDWTGTDTPVLFTEDFLDPVLNGESNIMHLEEIQKVSFTVYSVGSWRTAPK